jgi:hypothetical protein
MRHDPKLDLGIVSRNDFAAPRSDESLTHLAPFLSPDRNVLQIRVRRCQTPGHRGSLSERRVHPAVSLEHHLRELIGVGALQFAESAVLKNRLRKRISERKFGKHILTR